MQSTLNMMKSILTGKEVKVDEKELIKEYKEELFPNILAYFYTSNFNLIYRTSRLYPILDDEDKASFCLQELDKCLLDFDCSKNNKFITYFLKCYKNRLRTETEQILTSKRKILLYINDIDDSEQKIYSDDIYFDNYDSLLNKYNFNANELKQCKLLNERL